MIREHLLRIEKESKLLKGVTSLSFLWLEPLPTLIRVVVVATCSGPPWARASGTSPAGSWSPCVGHRPRQDDPPAPRLLAGPGGLRSPSPAAGQQPGLGGRQGHQRLHPSPVLPQRQKQTDGKGKHAPSVLQHHLWSGCLGHSIFMQASLFFFACSCWYRVELV